MVKKCFVAGVAVSTMVLSMVAAIAASRDAREVDIRDKCEAESFNAALGPGTCQDIGEDVTFEEFLEELNPKKGGHGAWRFNPDDTHIDEGESLLAINDGGEFHTFSEVGFFGGGCIPDLNGPLGLMPVPECDAVTVTPAGSVPTAFITTGVPPGLTLPVDGLSEGTHLFQCLIHPWMRTILEVRD